MKHPYTIGSLTAIGLIASVNIAWATECCRLNPNIKLYAMGECQSSGSLVKCDRIEKAVVNKVGLLKFLGDEAGETFPSNSKIILCPVTIPNEPQPNDSYVEEKDGTKTDVSSFLSFHVDFDHLIWQGRFDYDTFAERSKNRFPFIVKINGTQGGLTDIQLHGSALESFNARPDPDLMVEGDQKIRAKIVGNVVGDPTHDNKYLDIPVVADGHPVCVTNGKF